MLLKYSLTRFGSEVSASKKREETNETDSPAKKNLAIFKYENRSMANPFFRKELKTPKVRPFSFFVPAQHIMCEKVFRVFSGSTRVHIIKPKDG